MYWALMMWLASTPNVLIPGEYQHNTKEECLRERKREATVNTLSRVGGGVTYICMEI